MPNTEIDALLHCLDGRRQHILDALTGLTDAQLRRSVLPSGWHCLGLVKHLTLADERYWFSGILGGEPLNFFPEGPNADWQLDPPDTTESILAKYRNEISSSNAIINATQADQRPRQRDPLWDQWGVDFPDVRTVMLHMIVETATHAGHLDAVREILDGHQRLVM